MQERPRDVLVKPTTSTTVAPTTVAPRTEGPPILNRVNPFEVKVEAQEAAQILERWANSASADAKRVQTAHQAIEDGRQLVSLRAVMTQGWRRLAKWELPDLAVARADMSTVRCIVRRSGKTTFQAEHFPAFRWRYELSSQSWTRYDHDVRWVSGVSSLPVIPDYVRPEDPSKHLIVWEPTWRKKLERRDIHVDPALLEQIVGDLYVVTAAWELTPLEAAALSEG